MCNSISFNHTKWSSHTIDNTALTLTLQEGFTVLTGANGCGKSNILEAIGNDM